MVRPEIITRGGHFRLNTQHSTSSIQNLKVEQVGLKIGEFPLADKVSLFFDELPHFSIYLRLKRTTAG